VGNWTWRLPAGALDSELSRRFALLNRVHARA